MVWTFAGAILFCGLAMWVSDALAVVTKAKLPSLFVVSLIFMVGYWTILPKDFLDVAQVNTYATFALHVIMIHVGTLFDPKTVVREWKTVVITLSAVLGIFILVFGVGQFLYGRNDAVAMTPPFAGGMFATITISQGGSTEVATMAMLAMVMQGFVGFPLVNMAIKKEGAVILQKYQRGELQPVGAETAAETTQKKRLIDYIPARLKTPSWYLFELLIFAYLAVHLSALLNETFHTTLFSSTITCLIIGVLANIAGVIDREPVDKAKANGFLIWTMTLYLMGMLANSSLEMVVSKFLPLIAGLILATAGIYVCSVLVGKRLGYSKWFSFAVGLNCFLGFPTNYILVNESVCGMTEDEDERNVLITNLLPQMVIASIVAVSIVSVLLAGFMAPLLQ